MQAVSVVGIKCMVCSRRSEAVRPEEKHFWSTATARNITLQIIRRKIGRQRCLSVSKHSRIEVSTESLMRRCDCSQDPKIYGFLDEHVPRREITQCSRLVFGQRATLLLSERNVVVGTGVLSPDAVTAIYPRHVVDVFIGFLQPTAVPGSAAINYPFKQLDNTPARKT